MKLEGRLSWSQHVLRHAKVVGGSFTLVTAVITIVVLWRGDDWREQYINLLLLHGVYWIVILYLSWRIFDHICPQFFGIPRVKKVLQKDRLLIVENAPWLGIGVMTTIYVLEDDFERLVCIGQVVNVQINNLVQIAVRESDEGYPSEDEIWTTFDRSDKRMLLVKPGNYRGVG
jgi:hypothetical protein